MTLIDVPEKFHGLCTAWHEGQTSAMYGVASTGKVSEDHMLYLYEEASSLIAETKDQCDPDDPSSYDDWSLMRELTKWADNHVDWDDTIFSSEDVL